jgi:hypothetical protein
MSAGELPLAEARSPGALRSLAVGLRLAHANFLRLYPLALLVGVALEAAALGTDTATALHLFGKTPDRFLHDSDLSKGVLLFSRGLLVTVGWLLPVQLTTALVAHALREQLRGRPARPLASLGLGARSLHVAIATALAFAIVPLAALWFPTTVGDSRTVLRTYFWVIPLSLPLIAAVIGRWIFAVPAAVLERRGPIGAWRRSERLVTGRQLPTIGLVLLGLALWYALFGLLLSWIAGTTGILRVGVEESFGARVFECVRVALAAWFHLGVAAVTTVYFVDVRRAQEGPDADELRRVFK